MAKSTRQTEPQDLKSLLQRLVELLAKEEQGGRSDEKKEQPFLCAIQPLPRDKWVSAAAKAMQINPANRPATHLLGMATKSAMAEIGSPESLAVVTSKYWGSSGVRLTVGFLEPTAPDLRDRLLSHMNAWSDYANVQFTYSTTDPQVRITRASGGYKSYLGTDILSANPNEPTMWLQGFTMGTEDSEFHRVVRHETGHTLGFPHEHTRQEIVDDIDREKAITYFIRTQGWSRDEVIAQVLTPLDQSAIMATAQADPISIMCYALPGAIMKDGQAIPGGTDIDSQDAQFAALMYPKTGAAPTTFSQFY